MKQLLLLVLFSSASVVSKAQINKEIFEFQFEGVTINGALNMPTNVSPKGIVLIIHGSGQTNAVAQEWHYDVREQLVKSGYAVYMWDKMGCGNSGGTFDYNQPVENSAEEAIAAIKALKEQDISGSEHIGLWGISRAGWIIPLIINQREDIQFWISVSGVTGKENFGYLLEQNLIIEGKSEAYAQLIFDEWMMGNQITHGGGSYEAFLAATENLRNDEFINRFNSSEYSKEGYYNYQKTFMNEALDIESGLPLYIKNFDTILKKVDVPVLALFGELDKNVDWQEVEELYERTLGVNTNLTVQSFPGCNHNLFESITGGFYEFEDNNLPWNRCDGFLETIEVWLQELY